VHSPTPPPLSQIDQLVKELLPPSYQDQALEFLQKLQNDAQLGISESRTLQVGDRQSNYPIDEFIRATCVPFNTAVLPIDVQSWLRANNIEKLPNKGEKILPPWKNVYSWKKSTLAARQLPTEDPTHSINA
jgi:hypothetical protein